MVVYDRFGFAAAPRTGSTWFLHAALEAGLGEGQKTHVHQPFPDDWNGFKLSVVRHPYYWLVSYHLALEGGAVGVPTIDRLCEISKRNISVEAFLADYLDTCPGAVTEIFYSYRADSFIRHEDFPWGVIEFFESLGVSHANLQKLKSLDRLNSRPGVPHTTDMGLLHRVCSAERKLCDEFDYYG